MKPLRNDLYKQIDSYLHELNMAQLAKVFQFLENLKGQQAPRPIFGEAIDRICGKYRLNLTASQQFAERKKAEIELEERKWQR